MIEKYPNKILTTSCKKVKDFNVEDIIQKMYITMISNNGCGLAANQIGINKQICIIHFEGKDYELINPEIIEEKGFQYQEEGCLSSDDNSFIITKRPRKLKIKYQGKQGETRKLSAKGRLAQIISHEIDHLNGIYYKERELK